MKNFGETLKKIRKQKDMTQEQLAEYLNISPQSVSKWETSLTLPDITLIPMIANIFDVTTDMLLGVDIDAKDKCIQRIVKQAEEYVRNEYNLKEATQILREGLKEYPNSYKIMSSLMSCVWRERFGEADSDERIECLTEAIKLGEKILAECTDDECRHNAIQVLCFIYPDSQINEREKALELAEKMPHTAVSRQNLLSQIYTGNKLLNLRRDNLFGNIINIFTGLIYLNVRLDDGSYPYTTEEMFIFHKKGIELFNLLFDDGNYGLYRECVAERYTVIAGYYANLEDYDNAIENLKLAMEQAMICDKELEEGTADKEYTSLPFRGEKFGRHFIEESNCATKRQLELMERSTFDIIRKNKDFIEIEKQLKECKNGITN